MAMAFDSGGTKKEIDIYQNPNNLDIAPVSDYVEECKKTRQQQAQARAARAAQKGSDRHPDWSPYFRSSYEGADQSTRVNLVCGELVPQNLRRYPSNFPATMGGGDAAAKKKAMVDAQGIPSWSMYYRGADNPMQRRVPREDPLRSSRPTHRTAMKQAEASLVNDRSSARSSGECPPFNEAGEKGHMFETTIQEQTRREAFFRNERAKSAPVTRQPFQTGGSYKPRWAGGGVLPEE